MQSLEFPTKNHLTPTDQERLVRMAKSNGQTPEEFVETLIKRELFKGASGRETRKVRKSHNHS